MRKLRLAALLFALMITGVVQANAATLFGKVIEVPDGDVITIINQNRPARIRLLGVDAPEKNQPFGDVARQHLNDLVLGQNVVVEYSGIGRDGTIVGRVLFRDADINAQMIRDGAAWFDPRSAGEIRQEMSDVYSQSEQAARAEKRGLWQTEGAIAPWEFVKNEELKRQQAIAGPIRSLDNPKPVRRQTDLTSESLIRTGSNGIAATDLKWTSASEAGRWERFQPNGQNFSAMVPTGGKLSREPIPFGDTYIDMNYYIVKDGTAVYTLMWADGPSTAETDMQVIKSSLNGLLRGVGAGFESLGSKFSCDPGPGADASSGGFTGRNFSLTGCTVPGVARVFTKDGAGKRQVYLGAVFYSQKDDNVDRFTRSFTINGSRAAKPESTKPARSSSK